MIAGGRCSLSLRRIVLTEGYVVVKALGSRGRGGRRANRHGDAGVVEMGRERLFLVLLEGGRLGGLGFLACFSFSLLFLVSLSLLLTFLFLCVLLAKLAFPGCQGGGRWDR